MAYLRSANEYHMHLLHMTREDIGDVTELCYIDKKVFVANLGWLLSQTREDVIDVRLKDNDTATIEFFGGHTKDVNIRMDSYLAIIKDVVNAI